MSENYCCRNCEEMIVAVVRNRSGIDSGEIDYTLKCERFDRQDVSSLLDMISVMRELILKCEDRIISLGQPHN